MKGIKKSFPILKNFILSPCYRYPDIVTSRTENKEHNEMACCAEIGLQRKSVKLIKLHPYYSNSLLDCHYHPFT